MAAINQWTAPKSWIGGEVAKAAKLNEQLRDNLTWLKSRPFVAGATGAVTTTSATFVTMTNSTVNLTTTGGYILFWATGYYFNSAGGLGTFDLAIDGLRQGHATFGTTLLQGLLANYNDNLNIMMITGGGAGGSLLAAGAHTCSLQWYVNSGTGNVDLKIFAMELC